jgi:hypothetical protein
MDIRSLQKPFKEKYRADPSASRIKLRASGSAMGVPVERIEATVEGDLDLRGTLGLSRDVGIAIRADPAPLRHRGAVRDGRSDPSAAGED